MLRQFFLKQDSEILLKTLCHLNYLVERPVSWGKTKLFNIFGKEISTKPAARDFPKINTPRK